MKLQDYCAYALLGMFTYVGVAMGLAIASIAKE